MTFRKCFLLWMFSFLLIAPVVLVSASHVHSNETANDASNVGHIKLGLAAAFFFSVVLACGLPIAVIQCLKRKANARGIEVAINDAETRSTSLGVENHSVSAFTTPKHSTTRAPDIPNGTSLGMTHAEHTRLSLESEPLSPPSTTNAETMQLLTGQPIVNAWPRARRERATNVLEARAKRLVKPSMLTTADGAQLKMKYTESAMNRKRLLHMWLSRLNCCAAGVFLSSGFMELYVDVEEAIDEAKNALQITSHFPFAPFVSLLGFFMVLCIEQFVWTARSYRLRTLEQRRPSATPSATTPLSPPNSSSQSRRFSFTNDLAVNTSSAEGHGHSHLPTMDSIDSFGSLLRVLVLLCAMSVHSLFEGLAVGLQSTVTQTLGLFSAILLHKIIIAVSIGMNLATIDIPPVLEEPNTIEAEDQLANCTDENNTTTRQTYTNTATAGRKLRVYQIFSTFALAISSPIGVLVGWALMQQKQSPVLLMTTAVLQALACGTFFYVVFCELLPEEFRGAVGDRLGKLSFLILGFCLVCLYSFLVPH